ncbi:unnamed protein product [Ilex paraguariensis]|uniref:Polysaccharide biosynthesis domain-containing protein n=1 Tax=Ilex paraguariensis TaxID=185542 RepID=A0ABC8TLF1_9AQUA
MPPESSPCHHPLGTPLTPLLSPISPKSRLHPSRNLSHCQGTRRMVITKKNLIPLLVFVLSTLSILRLLKLAITTSSSPPALPPTLALHTQGPSSSRPIFPANANALTEKELRFLSDLISNRAPCNLLVFGLEQQYMDLSSLNAGGITIFLEDNSDKLSTIKSNSNSSRVYKVEYPTPAREAYKLLKHARKNPGCSPNTGLLEASLKCKLALKELPKEVVELRWDVVVVDGPSGDGPEAPGRMAVIYSAGILARSGNLTDVVVHDVDRMIEKWFSWEFLCEENLVSSKDNNNSFRYFL